MKYYFEKLTDYSFEETIDKTIEELKNNGLKC